MRNPIGTLLDESVIPTANEREIRLRNAAGRTVVLRSGADPDVSISEEVSGSFRNRTAIEVKGGTDASNRLNRLGEAEKSHLKARQAGYTEFWTISGVPVSPADVQANTPTTTRFFVFADIGALGTPAHAEFADAIGIALGIPVAGH